MVSAIIQSQEYLEKQLSGLYVAVQTERFIMHVPVNDPIVGKVIKEEKTWEPSISRLIAKVLRPGDAFIDVGANLGWFTLLASSLVGTKGQVLSFEPSPENCQALFRSLLANKFSHVSVYPLALSKDSKVYGYSSHWDDDVSTGGSNGSLREAEKSAELLKSSLGVQQFAQSIRLDGNLLPPLPLRAIKIDVEGHELDVMEGMAQCINDRRPICFFEFYPLLLNRSRNRGSAALLDFFTEREYRLCIPQKEGSPQPIVDLKEFERKTIESRSHVDLVAVPKEIQVVELFK